MIPTPSEYQHPNYRTDVLTRLDSAEAGRVVLQAIQRITGRTPPVLISRPDSAMPKRFLSLPGKGNQGPRASRPRRNRGEIP